MGHLSINRALLEVNQAPFFAQKSITMKVLKECPETIPQLAQWMYDKWKSYDASLTLEKMVGSFKERLNDDRIPFVIVAFMKDKPIGMVGLKEQGAQELSNLSPKNTPWLGALFVEETQRKKGIGKQLLNLALTLAKEMGHPEVFVYTSDHTNVNWYTEKGASVVKDHYPFRDHEITLMKFNDH